MAEAISLEKDDFTLLMTYAELLHQDGQNDDALAADRRREQADEQPGGSRADPRRRRSRCTRRPRSSASRSTRCRRNSTPARTRPPTAGCGWPATTRRTGSPTRRPRRSRKAATKDPKSVPVLIAAARIYESRRQPARGRRHQPQARRPRPPLPHRVPARPSPSWNSGSAGASRRCKPAATCSPRRPGNPEVYKFFADLCFQLGDQDEGLEALRRSVRANPSDPQGLITLANALGERVRQGEAIELLWRAFEKTNELEGKLGIIDRHHAAVPGEQPVRPAAGAAGARAPRGRQGPRDDHVHRPGVHHRRRPRHRPAATRTAAHREHPRHAPARPTRHAVRAEGDIAAAVKYQRQLNAAAPNNYDHQLQARPTAHPRPARPTRPPTSG